jgi:hypothetical protein
MSRWLHTCPRRMLLAVPLLAVLLMPSTASAQERCYLWIFSSQSEPKLPRYTHTWATFARVIDCNGQRRIEAFTLSWMPATLNIRTFALRSEPGVNLDIQTTLRFVQSEGERISVWGPYAISPVLYGRAVEQKWRLETGHVRYRTIDPLIRNTDISDCIHAVSDIAPDQTRLNYIETVFFGEAAGQHIARVFSRRGLTCPVSENLCWLEQALGMHCVPITRRD